MSRYEDESEGPDESEDTDPVVRELRTQIVRLQAQLDQLQASVRERADEAAGIRSKLAELELILDRLKARRRREDKQLVIAWLIAVFSLSTLLYWAFIT